ncbi:MAG: OmpH family outer membrane protein [Bacteroidales bacterium]
MKNVNYLINGILAVAVIGLYIMYFTGHKKSESAGVAESKTIDASEVLPIAYINVDTLLNSYNFFNDINESLVRKQEGARASLNEKVRQLENEMKEFQRKIQNNAFLSQERAEAEQSRLIKKQQELQQLEQRLSMDIMKEQQKMNEQLNDSIYNFIKQFNKDQKYHLIISNTGNDNLLYADKSYDITKEVVEGLNSRYTTKASK